MFIFFRGLFSIILGVTKRCLSNTRKEKRCGKGGGRRARWRQWWRTYSNRSEKRVSALSSGSSRMKATCLSLFFPSLLNFPQLMHSIFCESFWFFTSNSYCLVQSSCYSTFLIIWNETQIWFNSSLFIKCCDCQRIFAVHYSEKCSGRLLRVSSFHE